jgi:hypothetical protein
MCCLFLHTHDLANPHLCTIPHADEVAAAARLIHQTPTTAPHNQTQQKQAHSCTCASSPTLMRWLLLPGWNTKSSTVFL